MKYKDGDTACARKEVAGVKEQRRTVNEKMRVTCCPMALRDKCIMETENASCRFKSAKTDHTEA